LNSETLSTIRAKSFLILNEGVLKLIAAAGKRAQSLAVTLHWAALSNQAWSGYHETFQFLLFGFPSHHSWLWPGLAKPAKAPLVSVNINTASAAEVAKCLQGSANPGGRLSLSIAKPTGAFPR